MSRSPLLQQWKSEPLSPLLTIDEDDNWVFFESDNEIKNEKSPISRAEVAQQLLDDIEHLDDIQHFVKEDEPFNDWFEEKMDLQMFEDVTPVVEETRIQSMKSEQTFDFRVSQLTPPQSPPSTIDTSQVFDLGLTQQNYINLQPYQFEFIPPSQHTYITLQPTIEILKPTESITVLPVPVELQPPCSPMPDIARELAVVDELVRSTAQDLDSNWDNWDTETSNSSYPASTSSSSPRSSSTEDEDPEWIPDSDPPVRIGKITNKSNRRSKPYVRSANVEDKKLRKKEQNKNAATRYRQKKKAEVHVILEEEKILQDQHDELKKEAAEVEREIKYLKDLMRDLIKAKKQC